MDISALLILPVCEHEVSVLSGHVCFPVSFIMRFFGESFTSLVKVFLGGRDRYFIVLYICMAIVNSIAFFYS